ncbi:MAG: hypothetical protein M3Y07_04755 [Acidobacteriota bacterium]|nr:hypothetical protein [Acidobacteriota bacterium]
MTELLNGKVKVTDFHPRSNATGTSPRIVRFLPSLTDVAFLIPIFFLFFKLDGATSMLGDGDTGWHIRTGEWILRNGRIPHTDIFSFTKPGEPWFAWEWLWDVAFAGIHKHGGMAGVVLINILLISLTFALLFRLVRRKCSNDWISLAVTLLAAIGSSIHWLARPHLVTLFFVVIFCSVLDRVQDGNTRLLWVLPALTVLWTNLHGGFFVGIALLGAYAAGEIASALVVKNSAGFQPCKPYLSAAFGCLLASLINPYFYRLHVHILQYLSDSYQLRNISEFQSISFQSPAATYFEVMLMLGMAAVLWSLTRMQFAYVILIAGWAHLALISARNIPIFLIVTAPVVAEMLSVGLERLHTASVSGWVRRSAAATQRIATEFGAVDRMGRVPLFSGVAALVLAAGFFAATPSPKFRARYDPKKYPEKALAVLRNAELSKTIFTHDEWGDYLIYQLYPHSKVFIDGRSDFYGAKFGEKYLDIMNVKYDWEENLARYGVDTVLLPPDAALSSTLKESKRWRPIYDDGVAIVFRSTRANQVSAAVRDGGKDRDRAIDKHIEKQIERSQPL